MNHTAKMKEYRVQIFHDNTSDNTYYENRDEAIIFGAKQLAKSKITAIFLLKHVIDNKYDVEMQIQ